MPKGYWMAHVDVADDEGYKEYVAMNAEPIAAHGGRFLVRGGQFTPIEGTKRSRNVIIEFPSYQAALDCMNSDGYQAALAVRRKYSTADIIVIEGYDGPQPGE
ncbi:DUF1330 domain-containing protein [Acuticoccus mangrovi]|uniref:DUF1330 domain-containing protein n=1 Tax=Acuticoccus mangrovi TaxID=2796142 RepID=A0A934IRC7_9HYPH|nr:DUF1330 domain-containing protein [Acuticoccus mangrovi]MBJ3777245.1 DUF1330 domain-containing protein [Acuticoccus mangrovi]